MDPITTLTTSTYGPALGVPREPAEMAETSAVNKHSHVGRPSWIKI